MNYFSVKMLRAIGLILIVSFKIYGTNHPTQKFILENKYIKRTFLIVDGSLKTDQIVNKRNNKILRPVHCDEFRLRISQGTHTTGTDEILTTLDFIFTETHPYKISKNVHGIELPSESLVSGTQRLTKPKLRMIIALNKVWSFPKIMLRTHQSPLTTMLFQNTLYIDHL